MYISVAAFTSLSFTLSWFMWASVMSPGPERQLGISLGGEDCGVSPVRGSGEAAAVQYSFHISAQYCNNW